LLYSIDLKMNWRLLQRRDFVAILLAIAVLGVVFFGYVKASSSDVALVVVMAFFAIRMSLQALRRAMPSAQETPYIARAGGLAGATAK
jgi:hypothetical protein